MSVRWKSATSKARQTNLFIPYNNYIICVGSVYIRFFNISQFSFIMYLCPRILISSHIIFCRIKEANVPINDNSVDRWQVVLCTSAHKMNISRSACANRFMNHLIILNLNVRCPIRVITPILNIYVRILKNYAGITVYFL